MNNIKVYQTSHVISTQVTNAFAAGCDGQIVPALSGLLDGDAAMYGILRGTGEIIQECERIGRDYYYIDLGYFERSVHITHNYGGYYRVTKNANQHNGLGNHSFDRIDQLKVNLKPWRTTGTNIVVCPLSRYVGEFLGIKPIDWLRDTIDELSKHTDRPIIIKPKDSDQSLQATLKDAYAVVAYNSNALVDAALDGVQVFYTDPACCLTPVGRSDFSQIETTFCPDREQWLANLAANQWTLEEMRDGIAWTELQENA